MYSITFPISFSKHFFFHVFSLPEGVPWDSPSSTLYLTFYLSSTTTQDVDRYIKRIAMTRTFVSRTQRSAVGAAAATTTAAASVSTSLAAAAASVPLQSRFRRSSLRPSSSRQLLIAPACPQFPSYAFDKFSLMYDQIYIKIIENSFKALLQVQELWYRINRYFSYFLKWFVDFGKDQQFLVNSEIN